MILEVLRKEQIDALKSKDAFRLGVIRYLLAQILNKEIELRPLKQVLDDEVILSVLKKQVKKRTEVIEEFRNAGRQDLVDKESKELEIVKEYLTRFGHE
ncbi:hypothetical protein A2W32_02630 [candidate division WWE3 bacterium RBG_16_37_10]|uniref:Uncharacterized protein n=1 Tax=candidate division WWE3 bacterium RBG_16_37_10 TaxID=1802610 RepID=A0A1F4UVI6_UNCKA|nr:MAG: hypothetical protein A2W32_02630 [candidate division WWE3 bacterium RBG_16_37_10]